MRKPIWSRRNIIAHRSKYMTSNLCSAATGLLATSNGEAQLPPTEGRMPSRTIGVLLQHSQTLQQTENSLKHLLYEPCGSRKKLGLSFFVVVIDHDCRRIATASGEGKPLINPHNQRRGLEMNPDTTNQRWVDISWVFSREKDPDTYGLVRPSTPVFCFAIKCQVLVVCVSLVVPPLQRYTAVRISTVDDILTLRAMFSAMFASYLSFFHWTMLATS